jgi:hypothetical protein
MSIGQNYSNFLLNNDLNGWANAVRPINSYSNPHVSKTIQATWDKMEGNSITGIAEIPNTNGIFHLVTTDTGNKYVVSGQTGDYNFVKGGDYSDWTLADPYDPDYPDSGNPLQGMMIDASKLKELPKTKAYDGDDTFWTKMGPALVLGAATMGAGGLSGLFGGGATAAGTVPTGAMSIPGAFGGMSSTAALAPSVAPWVASPIINSGLASGIAALGTGATLGGGMNFSETLDKLLEGGYTNEDAWRMAEELTGGQPIDSMVNSFVAGEAGGSSSLVSDALKWAKEAFPNLSGDALLQAATKMIGNNMADKSVEKDLKKWMDEIKGASPISEAQRTQLGGMAMDRFGQDFLSPRIEGLMGEYNERGQQADDQYGRLAQLYDDPMSNPIMQAVSRLTAENAARKSAAGRGLNAGSMPAEMQDALMASLGQQYGNIANPMNATLGQLYQGQQVPVGAINALGNATTGAAQQGASMINAGSGTQQALGNYITNFAAPQNLQYNPTLQGMNTLYSSGGALSSRPASNTSGLEKIATDIGGSLLKKWIGA